MSIVWMLSIGLAIALPYFPSASADHIAYPTGSLCWDISQMVLSSETSSCDSSHKGWNGYPHTFIMPELIGTIMERQAKKFGTVFALEVGSFSGGSAIRIVSQSKHLQLPPSKFCLMCMDTWLGDVNMMSDRFAEGPKNDYRSWLKWDEYHQAHIMDAFCGNLRVADAVTSVVPLRAPSIVGMKVLQRFVDRVGLRRPSMLYLDSAHEPLETLIELGLAWELLAEDGVLFGDDYGWASVSHDVRRFAFLRGLKVHVYMGQWILLKPGASAAAAAPANRTLTFNRDFLVMTNVDRGVSILHHKSMRSLRAYLLYDSQ